jgi:hypothetical protein
MAPDCVSFVRVSTRVPFVSVVKTHRLFAGVNRKWSPPSLALPTGCI